MGLIAAIQGHPYVSTYVKNNVPFSSNSPSQGTLKMRNILNKATGNGIPLPPMAQSSAGSRTHVAQNVSEAQGYAPAREGNPWRVYALVAVVGLGLFMWAKRGNRQLRKKFSTIGNVKWT